MDLHITVLGMGPEGLVMRDSLVAGAEVYLRTIRHPAAAAAVREGARSFEELFRDAAPHQAYRRLTEALLERARQGAQVVYAVPGNPAVGDDSVALLRRRARREGIRVEVIPATGALEEAVAVGIVDPTAGVAIRDAYTLDQDPPGGEVDLLITQVYGRVALLATGLTLATVYPPDHPVVVFQKSRRRHTTVEGLGSLGRLEVNAFLFVPRRAQERDRLGALVQVMERLLGPEGCPWDREQNHRSLRPYVVEEAYEVVEAIDEGNPAMLQEELGDLLLQVVFHASLAAEEGKFSLADVIQGIVDKLVRRHPHVFGTVKGDLPWDPRGQLASDQVVDNWQKIKEGEKSRSIVSKLDGVPRQFPSLLRAQKLQGKAARVGFDWPDHRGALQKVREELGELEEAIGKDEGQMEEELGDLLFAVVNTARLLSLDAEVAMSSACDKFVRRFCWMEETMRADGKDLMQMTDAAWDELWNKVKKIEGKRGIGANSAN